MAHYKTTVKASIQSLSQDKVKTCGADKEDVVEQTLTHDTIAKAKVIMKKVQGRVSKPIPANPMFSTGAELFTQGGGIPSETGRPEPSTDVIGTNDEKVIPGKDVER